MDDLEDLARDGWLTPGSTDPRLKLVKHGSGTYLILSYKDGWGTTLVQADFWRR